MMYFPAVRRVTLAFVLALSVVRRVEAQPQSQPQSRSQSRSAIGLTLDPSTHLDVENGRAVWTEYRGRKALHLAPLIGHEHDTDQELSAVISGFDFTDGVIEVDVAGSRRQGYATDDASAFKGFVGVSFRVRGDTNERFYIRPENSRLPSQLFRNRTTQYEATPDWPWQKLRQASPGEYESYADMEAGAWTKLRIEVWSDTAKLFVNGSAQPALIVTSLKHGRSRGAIALWTRISSDAYFSNLRVSERSRASTTPAESKKVVVEPIAGALPKFSKVLNASSEVVMYRGARAVHLVPAAELKGKDEAMMAIVDGTAFGDGTIEATVAGKPGVNAPADSRGFIGIAFRTGTAGEWSEVFYLRPTNAGAIDQLRRNHSVQYVSHPDFTWSRLRGESPGVYESNVDLEPGVWTSMRIEVAGTTAKLFVNGAAQPALVVNDLKRGVGSGAVALWAHVETDAYFGPVRVTPAR